MRRFRKPVRVLLAGALGLGLAVVGLEVGLRFLLFSDSSLARRLGAPWRRAEWYADPRGEDAYWKLQYLFLDPSERIEPSHPDPVCGWTGALKPGSYEPFVETDLRGRRPVLLYGDSNAQCTTTTSHCFASLLEQSSLSDRLCMINLGVGGYGVDQIDLLLRSTIDHWKDLDPIVVVSFFVDDDFHRNTLTFRGWPKPRFTIEGDRLATSGPPILPADEFLERNPVGIRSYLWRFLVFRRKNLPASWRVHLLRAFDHRSEQIALGGKILEDMHAELAARGLTHFFFAFHGWDSLQPTPGTRWADELATGTAARLGVPLIGTRPFLLAAAGGNVPLAGELLFERRRNQYGHYNDVGNWVAFEAMKQGIAASIGEGRFEPPDTARAAGLLDWIPRDDSKPGGERRIDTTFLGSVARVQLLGKSGLARSSSVLYPPFSVTPSRDYLILRPGEDGPTRVRIAIPEGAASFRGTAIAVARNPTPGSGSGLSLSVALDSRIVLSVEPPAFPAGTDIDLDLEGARELELVASSAGPFTAASWIHLAEAGFSWKP